MGFALSFFMTRKPTRYSLLSVPRNIFLGGRGVVHGGVQCALVDEVSFWAMFNKTRKIALTAKIEMLYMKKVPSGRTLDVRAKIREIRGRRVEVDSVIRDEDGTELASAAITYVFPRKETLREILGPDRLSEEFLQYVRD